ncbi:MAG: hypothetical protein HY593_04770 [Candidatus Omnitrophica bacterium]|nr:hypothetical protein [Candidatus Omnitrophota bacterium]
MLAWIRFLVGFFFTASGFLKLIRPYEEFLFVVQSYAVLPDFGEALVARVLPWFEFFLGVFLLLGFWFRTALWALWALVSVFMGVVGLALYRKLEIEDCGCLGGFSLPLHQTLLLDVVLWFLLGAMVVFWRRRS